MNSILVVEDELSICESLQELLEANGYKVLTARNGAEGLSVARSQKPNLIISDIRMPMMDGLEMMSYLQDDPGTAAIPVIFLSAKVELEDMRNGMLSGADDYIYKPFKAEEIIKAVELRLKKKDNYLKIVEQLQNRFIKNVPAELRNPLISILGFSELIGKDFESLSGQELKEIARLINESGKKLHGRIEKLIHFSYLLSFQENNDPTIVTEIIPKLYMKTIKSLATTFGRDSDVDTCFICAKIKLSSSYFEVILSELLENAIHYSAPGTPIVTTGSVEKGEYKIEISHIQSNENITSITNAELFDKIEDISGDLRELDLGLVIVKRIIEMINGRIEFKFEQDDFISVSIFIPLEDKMQVGIHN